MTAETDQISQLNETVLPEMTKPAVESETTILKTALIHLLALANGASYIQKKATIGKEVLALLGEDEMAKLDLLHTKKKPVAQPSRKKNSATLDDVVVSGKAKKFEQEERVRQQLREAQSEADLRTALTTARELGMTFEVSLGEKKLERLS